jgi:hypothetical protein
MEGSAPERGELINYVARCTAKPAIIISSTTNVRPGSTTQHTPGLRKFRGT